MKQRHVITAALALALAACAGTRPRPEPSLISMASGLPRTPEQVHTQIESVLLKLRVDPRRQWLDGDASLAVRFDPPQSQLVLDLDRNFEIRAIEVDGRAVVDWRNPEGRLIVPLAPATASAQIRIEYAGHPRVAKNAPWDGGFVFAKTAAGQDWIATTVQGEGCDLFWPCIDHPGGEPLVVEQHITVPAPLMAVGNGVALEHSVAEDWNTWRWRTQRPNTYAIALNIGPYGHLHDEYQSRFGNRFPIDLWYLEGHEEQARKLFGEFPRMLDFFEQMIGPYPFAEEKMGVVETPHLGMEHQTVNAYGNAYKVDEFGFDWLLQHEFAHEYFGNQVTNSDWDHMWLHEGFGAYMQPLYTQWLHGDMAYHARLFTQRKSLVNRFPVVSRRSQCEHMVYHPEHGPGGDIYTKGSLILHSLRALIGDARFFAATRRLVYGSEQPKPGEFAPRLASTADFLADVNAVTGGDFAWFFDVYLYDAALPELVEQRGADSLDLSWKVAGNKPFPMPVEVSVNGDLRVWRPGDGPIPVNRDDVVVIDPASKLLRALPYIDAWKATQEPRAGRRVTPVDPADPCRPH